MTASAEDEARARLALIDEIEARVRHDPGCHECDLFRRIIEALASRVSTPLSEPHPVQPTSASGRVDTKVYCATCRGSVFLHETGTWLHVAGERSADTTPPEASAVSSPSACGCSCHTMPGVMHISPCCYPDTAVSTPPTITDAAALRELVDRGVGFDMTPTFLFDSAEGVYAQWAAYVRRIDDAWRERVAAALHPGGEG